MAVGLQVFLRIFGCNTVFRGRMIAGEFADLSPTDKSDTRGQRGQGAKLDDGAFRSVSCDSDIVPQTQPKLQSPKILCTTSATAMQCV